MNSLRVTAKLRFGSLSPSGRTFTYNSGTSRAAQVQPLKFKA